MISAQPCSPTESEESQRTHSNRISPVPHRHAVPVSQVGRILCERYRLEAELGSGSMGRVFQATDLKVGQRVAVKLVLPEARSQLQAHLRIANEARIASRLHHPNIVSAHQFRRDADGTELLVLELLDGVDLREYLSLYGRMPLPRALAVLRGLGSALQYAHTLGIAHCDIKPENVFLSRERTVYGVVHETVKLLDFGLARLFCETDNGQKDALGQALALGTAEYLAPELLAEGAVADARSDQWSLAVLAYEILSGQLPFKGQVPFALRRAICRVEPRPLGQLVSPLPRQVERAIAIALAKTPQHRFASIGQFLHALENPMPPEGDTLGGIQPALGAQEPTWVHEEDLIALPDAKPSDVLRTVQYSADELLALARQSVVGMSNIPQSIPDDLPTKPYIVTDAELRSLSERPISPVSEFGAASPSTTSPPLVAPAAEMASSAASLRSIDPPAKEKSRPASARADAREQNIRPESMAPEPSPSAALPIIPQARLRKTPWFTIGAGSALFCLGFLLALIWTARHPYRPPGSVQKAAQKTLAFAYLDQSASPGPGPIGDGNRSLRKRLGILLNKDLFDAKYSVYTELGSAQSAVELHGWDQH